MNRKPAPVETVRTPLGRPKDAAKRDGILRAATALFMKEGYTLTSMEAVAKKADVSKLTIYSHFANKDELFKAIIQHRCDKLGMPESYSAIADRAPEDALTELATKFVALIFNEDSLRLHRIIQAEATRHPQVVKIFYEAGPRRVKAAFSELLEEWNRRGELEIPDIALANEQFFSLLKGEKHTKMMLRIIAKPTPAELDQHVKSAVKLFLAGYRPSSKLKAKQVHHEN